MRGMINDGLRWLIGLGILALGLVLQIVLWSRCRAFFWEQKRLKRRYQITPDTSVLSYGPEIEELIQEAAVRAGSSTKFVLTSGSTASPKRIPYTRSHLRSVKMTYIDAFARMYWALPIQRKSLYVFSALKQDDSLTSILLEETDLPPYISTLQAPYRVQGHPAIQALASSYGVTAVRLWILALANPGVLYSTNPSTLSTFLDERVTDWRGSSRLIRDFYQDSQRFEGTVRRIARRLDARGSKERLQRIAASEVPLPLEACAPAVEAYVCWTGGYVKPFLDRIASYLSPDRYRLIPMYSMSTETIQTVSHFHEDGVAFLPLAPGVLYEFLDEEAEDRPENLLTADQLQVGKAYTMVVSNQYGLRRYQTGDVFLVHGCVAGLPDLHFLCRRGLEYSFTGEKLTGEQLNVLFQKLREEHPWLGTDAFLTCVPSQPADEPVPHYNIILVGGCGNPKIHDEEVASRCDVLLTELNGEYKSKRESRRLGRVQFFCVPLSEFVELMGGSRLRDSWETQFKFLPLYRRTWELLQTGYFDQIKEVDNAQHRS